MEDLKFDNAKVLYDKKYLSPDNSKILFEEIKKLFDTEIFRSVIKEDGKTVYKLNRKTIVFIDKDLDRTIIPKLWGNDVTILEFSEQMMILKGRLEKDLSFKFTICLANYYPTGKSSIGFHSDNEEKGSTSCIASISLGTIRKMYFRKKGTKEINKTIELENGSLLVMADKCQENNEHAILHDK